MQLLLESVLYQCDSMITDNLIIISMFASSLFITRNAEHMEAKQNG